VETLQPDPRAALDFYGALLGWEFAGPGPRPGGLSGEYFVARVDGRDVAGIGSLADVGPAPVASWATYVRVDSVEESTERAKVAGGNVLIGALDALPQPAAFGSPEAALTLWRPPGYAGEEGQPIPRDVVAVMAPAADEAAATVPPHWNVNLRVGDADATVEQAAGLGGQILLAPPDTPGFRSAVVADPQGAVFSISQLIAGA
jgi:predicted enzyme related to lactoylglutathione lyase